MCTAPHVCRDEGDIRGTARRQIWNPKPCKEGEYLLIVEIPVAGQDVLLELCLVRVPELCGLGVQRARTIVYCQ